LRGHEEQDEQHNGQQNTVRFGGFRCVFRLHRRLGSDICSFVTKGSFSLSGVSKVVAGAFSTS